MKHSNKSSKRCCNKKFNTSNKALNRTILQYNKKWKIIYNKRNRKYRFIRNQVEQARLDEYVFYSILNIDIAMKLGVAASTITRGILALYNQLITNRAKSPFLKLWQNSGENIIVFRGYDHKHLKYLQNEVKFIALGKHAIYQRRNHIMLVLSVFGRREEIEDVFEGLSRL